MSLVLETLFHVVASSLMIGMPLLFAAWLKQKLPSPWKWFRVGAGTFVASQVLHIPFNVFVLSPLLEHMGLDITQDQGMKLAVASLLLGLSAGIFEEFSRLVMYRYFVKPNQRTFKSAIMLGAGHGGSESIIFGVFSLIALIQMSVLQHYGHLSKLGIPADQMEQLEEAIVKYWNSPWYEVLLGPLERVYAILFHLSASVLVWQSVLYGRSLWLGAAILYHTALDGIALYVLQTWNGYVVEGLLTITSLPLSLYIIWYFQDPVQFLPVSQGDCDDEDQALIDVEGHPK